MKKNGEINIELDRMHTRKIIMLRYKPRQEALRKSLTDVYRHSWDGDIILHRDYAESEHGCYRDW